MFCRKARVQAALVRMGRKRMMRRVDRRPGIVLKWFELYEADGGVRVEFGGKGWRFTQLERPRRGVK
jgi:hypothetical protein